MRYNRIVVGPDQAIQYEAGEATPLWRRGRLRVQALEMQLSLRKFPFVAPTQIRADRLINTSPAYC